MHKGIGSFTLAYSPGGRGCHMHSCGTAPCPHFALSRGLGFWPLVLEAFFCVFVPLVALGI